MGSGHRTQPGWTSSRWLLLPTVLYRGVYNFSKVTQLGSDTPRIQNDVSDPFLSS